MIADFSEFSLTNNILSHDGLGGFPACGEDFQAPLAAGFGPLVVLPGQHRAGQADDGLAARTLAREGGEGCDVLAGTRRVETPGWQPVATTEASVPLHPAAVLQERGKHEPCRSLGIVSSVVPARVSRSRAR